MERLRLLRALVVDWWSDRPPAVRLAVAYVLVLTIFSLGFSAVLYQFADSQIVEGLRRQYFQLHRPEAGGFIVPSGLQSGASPVATMAAIQPLVDDARDAIVLRLAYLNVVIITLGGIISYWLAKRTVKPIEAALEAQSRFASDASHELRTPLAVMRTEIEIARADPKLSKQQALTLLDSTFEEVGKLHALAEALLRLARSHKQSLQLQPVTADVVINGAIGRVSTRAKAARVKLINDTGDVTVQADEVSLTELVAILLDNAIKYSKAGTAVTVSARRQGRYAYIAVADKGRGIAAADLPHIFNRFYRADPSRTSTDVEGHGLGLSIAKQIADVHGVTIDVTSVLGKGTTFTLRLPLA